MEQKTNKNLIFLDTETTGLENGRLVQLAFKKRGEKNMLVEFYKPPTPIDIEAMAVHHITEKKVAGKPPFEKTETFKTLSALLPNSILVAHNAKYDIGILEREGITISNYICTMKVAKAMYDFPNYKMQYLRYLWGIDDDEATTHDAEGDVIILEKVFDYMADEYASSNMLTPEATIDAFVEISKNPILLRRANFGKYAGKTFEEIKNVDRPYLEWMGSLKDKDEDFLYTVDHFLNHK